jgi:hypothetical protein
MAVSTLAEIRKKVRRLTRSPSENLLSTTELDQYINTFILYDFPQNIRVYNLRSSFTFYTQPNVDTYATSDDQNNALYNFKNKVVAVHPSVYIAGVPVYYTQSKDEFYGNYTKYSQITNQVAIADGTVGPFTGTIQSSPLLTNNVIISTITTNNLAMTVVDIPQNNETGVLTYPNIVDATTILGSINYLTGVFSVTFPNSTVSGNAITAEVVPYQAGQPTAVLFYDQKFTVRPVPDKVYPVEMQVDILPTELLASDQDPNLNQWWQYIAYGAAIKVFQDRMDTDSVDQIGTEFKRQESMVLSSTATTLANERSATIYTQRRSWSYGWWGFGRGPY